VKNTISAVLIAKDEEAVIGRCLESLKDLDEIVVLDTGSSDRTMEIAASLGAKVWQTAPTDPFHFAEARNAALDRATSQWALSIDADEVLSPDSSGLLRKAVAFTAHSSFRITFRFPGGREIQKRRLFRTSLYRWRWRIHEELVAVRKTGAVGDALEAVIEHHPKEGKEGPSERNLKLLHLAVVETPNHVKAWKKLGMEYFLRKNWEQAVRYLEEYVRKGGDRNPLEKSETLINLGLSYSGMDRIEDAVKFFEAASREAPDRREPWWHAAQELSKKAMPWAAIPFYEACLAIPPSRKPAFWLNLEPVWGNLPEEALTGARAEVERAKALFEAQKTRS